MSKSQAFLAVPSGSTGDLGAPIALTAPQLPDVAFRSAVRSDPPPSLNVGPLGIPEGRLLFPDVLGCPEPIRFSGQSRANCDAPPDA